MKHIVIVLLLTLPHSGNAQKRQGQARLDSLLAEAPKIKDDTAGVKLLDNVAFAYCNTNPEEGVKYAGRALTLAIKLGWKQGEAVSENELGNNYQNKGAYPQALDCFFKALRIDEEIGATQSAGMVSANIGTVYYYQKDYSRALDYYLRSEKAAIAIGDKADLQLAAGNIGMVYYSQGKYPEALSYMQHSLRIAEELDNRRGIINQLGNIANIYGSLKDNHTALAYSFKALRIAELIGDKQIIATSQGNIGLTYLDIAKSDTRPKPDSLVPAGRPANLAKATDYLKRGIAGCREVRYNEGLIELLQGLSEASTLYGDYQAALQAFKQYATLKDSIHNNTNAERIANLETARAIELKDKDIQIARLEVARKRNERWFFLTGIGLLLLILCMVAKGYKKQRHSNVQLSREKARSDNLLLNILPAEVAEELKEAAHPPQGIINRSAFFLQTL